MPYGLRREAGDLHMYPKSCTKRYEELPAGSWGRLGQDEAHPGPSPKKPVSACRGKTRRSPAPEVAATRDGAGLQTQLLP